MILYKMDKMIMNNYNTWVEINLDNVSHNIKKLKEITGDNVKIMAVVKANAYGHGAQEIADIVLKNGADFLGTASCYEAIVLRKTGIKSRIFITNAVLSDDVKEIVKNDLTPFVYTKELAQYLNKESIKQKKILPVHIKIDTGMGRVGLDPEKFSDFFNEFENYKNLNPEGILTHFAIADQSENFTRKQFNIFNNVLQKAKEKGIIFNFIHAANSAALIKYPFTHFNLVRPGLSIYGLYPDSESKDVIELEPAMQLKAKIAFIKHVPEGTSISYGRTFITNRPSIIATVPIGYADGYSRLLSNRAEVLLHGKRVKVAGTVCMDSIMIDITDFPQVKNGEIVTLIGQDGKEKISADELAEKIGTINYEIVSKIGPRIPRVYIHEGKIKNIRYI